MSGFTSLVRAIFTAVLFLFSSISLAAPGATPGSGSVSAVGSARYTIPIDVPAGINGMQPNLALVYSSWSRDGIAGQGWNLAGISRIERCGKIDDLNNYQTGVELDDNDRYCLDGEKLVRDTSSGNHGENYTVYHKAHDDLTRVILHTAGGAGSNPSSGPKWFEVHFPDGKELRYGYSSDSREIPEGTDIPNRWFVNKITDTFGNSVKFDYTDPGVYGSILPAAVRYTTTPTQGPIYWITFQYENRTPVERIPQYVAGHLQQKMSRLASIHIEHNQSEVRRYELNYASSSQTPSGRSRLDEVVQCVVSDCLAPTVIDWKTLEEGLLEDSYVTMNRGVEHSFLMDINGDGRKDIVYPYWDSSASEYYWAYNLATGTPESGLNFNSKVVTGRVAVNWETARPFEYDGDGRTDIIYKGSNGYWWVYRSTGSNFSVPQSTGLDSVDTGLNIWISDIDGDGLNDVTYAESTIEQHNFPSCEPGVPCYFNTGYTEFFYRLNNGDVSGNRFDASKLVYTRSGLLPVGGQWAAEEGFRAASGQPDFNGDGVSDLMILMEPVPQPDGCIGCPEPGMDWVWMPLRTRVFVDGGFLEIAGQESIAADVDPIYLDINGDGNTDLAYPNDSTGTWSVRLSNGKELMASVATSALASNKSDKAVVFDYNNDGRDDLLMPHSGAWKLALSDGKTLGSLQTVGLNWVTDQVARVGDFDGDSDGDLFLLYPISVNANFKRQYVQNKGEYGDLVAKVTDGLENSIAFTYGSSVDEGIHTRHSDGSSMNAKESRLFTPLTLVSRADFSDGSGGIFYRDYEYKEGVRSANGWGFLGFAETVVKDHRDYKTGNVDTDDFRKTTTEYHTSYPFEMLVKSIRQEKDSGATLSYKEYTWEIAHPFRSNANHARLTRIEDKEYFTAGSLTSDYVTTFDSFDAYDNPTSITIEHATNPSSHPKSVYTTTYDNETSGKLCLGMPTSVVQQNSRPGVSNITTKTTNTWDASTCQVSESKFGNYLQSEWRRTVMGRDTFGNVTSVTIDAFDAPPRTATIEHDGLGYRVTAVENALGHRVTSSWDATLRRLQSRMDANLLTTSYSYDAFGRMERVDNPDGSYLDIVLEDCGQVMCPESEFALKVTRQMKAFGTNDLAGKQVAYLDSTGRTRRAESYLMTLLGGVGNVAAQDVIYDQLGRVSSRSNVYAQGAAPVYTDYTFDNYSRVKTITGPDDTGALTVNSSISRSVVNGQPNIVFTDPVGNVTERILNALGEVESVIDADSNTLSFDYDASGRMIKSYKGLTTLAEMEYDDFNNRTRLIDSDLGDWSFDYNALGQLEGQTDAKGQVVNFQYDLLGRVTSRTEPEGTTTWTYDVATGASTGRPASVSGPGGYSNSFEYDSYGRLAGTESVIDSITYRYDYSYDAFGRLDTLTYPTSVMTSEGNRFAVEYGYDPLGNLSTVSNANNAAEVFWQANVMDA